MNTTFRSSPSPPGWSGLTIKEILERVDLFNVTTGGNEDLDMKKTMMKTDGFIEQTTVSKPLHQMYEQKTDNYGKSGALQLDASNPSAAFLGPKLWDNPICLPLSSEGSEPTTELSVDPYSVMDIEDFLLENNLASTVEVQSEEDEEEEEVVDPAPSRKKVNKDSGTKKNILPKTENTFLYGESKRAKAEREKVEETQRRQMLIELEEEQMEMEVEFAPEDLALATIPGIDFDPRKRAFSVDELKPQPIIKKRKKNYVSLESKDVTYWTKRKKNNVAARRSREARRLKENQIALRAVFLEKENSALRLRLKEAKVARDAAGRECKALKVQLSRYE